MEHGNWDVGDTMSMIDVLQDDPRLHALLTAEIDRQNESLLLVASCSPTHPSVLACLASVAGNVTAEGYPGRRYHGGCAIVDAIEQLAIDRAKAAFGAQYANVQPHSASTANQVVMLDLLEPGDTLLGMELASGGHLSHGAPVSLSGRLFRAFGYGVGADGWIDYEAVRRQALEVRPRLLVCGATAYSRAIDFERFRALADEAGAWLLADISHVAGLVVAGLYPNPIDAAHVTTTCTHKQLCGPRGGLILCGRDHDLVVPAKKRTLSSILQAGVFPLLQGAPIPSAIAAKACALGRCTTPDFRAMAVRIADNGRALAAALQDIGYTVVSGGTDSHIVLVDLTARRLTGVVAEQALEACGILVNRNRVPGDTKDARVASGIRLGTNTVAARVMGALQMVRCAELIDRVLGAIEQPEEATYSLPVATRARVADDVRALCREFPVPYYSRAVSDLI